jgi:hypothetical protein
MALSEKVITMFQIVFILKSLLSFLSQSCLLKSSFNFYNMSYFHSGVISNK